VVPLAVCDAVTEPAMPVADFPAEIAFRALVNVTATGAYHVTSTCELDAAIRSGTGDPDHVRASTAASRAASDGLPHVTADWLTGVFTS
jgi:hypothetical protein